MIAEPTAAFCPNCRSTELSDYWSGLVVIFNVEESKIAKLLNLAIPGRYALKVR